MKTNNLKIQKPVTNKKSVAKLKEDFRNWYGIVSVQELTENKKLLLEIESLEKAFLKKSA